jgi:hypothetical protein
MDYRNIPTATGHRPRLCGRCRVPFRERRDRGRALVGAAALYLLAATTLGLPLAFPARAQVWLVVNLALATAIGCLVAALQRSGRSARCPRCGRDRADSSIITGMAARVSECSE